MTPNELRAWAQEETSQTLIDEYEHIAQMIEAGRFIPHIGIIAGKEEVRAWLIRRVLARADNNSMRDEADKACIKCATNKRRSIFVVAIAVILVVVCRLICLL